MVVIAIDDIKSLINYDGSKNIFHRKSLTMMVLMRTIIVSHISMTVVEISVIESFV